MKQLHSSSRPEPLAALLWLALTVREFAWSWFPAEAQGMVSKGLGALLVLVLLAVVWRQSRRTWWLAGAVCYGCWAALQTALCSLAYLSAPWEVPPGVGICSARFDLDLGALALLAAALFALRASPVMSSTIAHKE